MGPNDHNGTANGLEHSNQIKDHDKWITGDERITGAQQSYLETLADEAGVEVDNDLTKAKASKRIDELQDQTGRGKNKQYAFGSF